MIGQPARRRFVSQSALCSFSAVEGGMQTCTCLIDVEDLDLARNLPSTEHTVDWFR